MSGSFNNGKELIKNLFSKDDKYTDKEYLQKLTSFMANMTDEEKLTIRMFIYDVVSFSKRNEEQEQIQMKRQIACEYIPPEPTEEELNEDLIKNLISITKLEDVEDLMEIYNECFSEM